MGGNGSDILTGGDGADTLNGGSGIDTANYALSDQGVTINLAGDADSDASGGHAAGDDLIDIENVTGSAYADTLTGDDGNNELQGLDGNDRLIGGRGADILRGGDGVDTADYSASIGSVNVDLVTGRGIGGDSNDDTLSGIENLTGSDQNR